MKKSILIIAAHPDDEVLGCGGTIAKHVDNGDEVNTIIIAEGLTSRRTQRNREIVKSQLSELSNAAKNAANILGVNNIEILDYPDNRMDSIDLLDIVKLIEKKIEKYRPSIIYTHHSGDVNIDHSVIHDAVITATRPIPGSFVKKIITFETASSTEWRPPDSKGIFKPNYFVTIEDQFQRKMDALNAYKCEMREWPHPRSIKSLENLAKLRGSQVGYKYAEAFCLLRGIS